MVELRAAYNFRLRAPQILGAGYDNAVVQAYADFTVAQGVQDVARLHRNAYTFLPDGTPRNPQDLTYIIIKTTSDERRVIAQEWLAAEPELVQLQNLRIMVSGVTADQIRDIRTRLVSAGYNNIDIAVVPYGTL